MKVSSDLGVRPTEVRFAQEVGGVFRLPTDLPLEDAAAAFERDFQKLYGTSPRIVGAVFDTADHTRLSGFREAVEPLTEYKPPPADIERIERRLDVKDRTSRARASARADPPSTKLANLDSPWAPQALDAIALEVDDYETADRYFQWYLYWSGNPDHDLRTYPDDWGMEVEFDLFLPLQYSCGGFDQDLFWAAWFRSYALYPYEDVDLGDYWDSRSGDPCERHLWTIGIGYPPNLVDAYPGQNLHYMSAEILAASSDIQFPQNESSVVRFQLQNVSNDCNNLGQRPNGLCMGLNFERPWPGPGAQTELGLNRTRGCGTPITLSLIAGNEPDYYCARLFD